MLTRKQWKFQRLAEQLYGVYLEVAGEAARHDANNQFGFTNEHGIIAEEIRRLREFVIGALERNIFDGLSDSDFDAMICDSMIMTSYLALNTALTASKMQLLKPLAVCADELRTISFELAALCGREISTNPFDVLQAEPVSLVTTDWVYLFTGVSGKYIWSENNQFVVEILAYCSEFIKDNKLQIQNKFRNMIDPLPIINLEKEKEPTEENSCLVIINDSKIRGRTYAVVADIPDVNAISNSHVGIQTKSPLDIPVRECWMANNGSYINFIDWGNIVK